MSENPSLEELQTAVGGFIQYVPTQSGGFLYCHEEGKMKGGLPNREATKIANLWADDYICGDVVVYTKEESDAEDERMEREAKGDEE